MPREVLGCLGGSLLQMLHCCLPDSFGPAGHVFEVSPTPIPRSLSKSRASQGKGDGGSEPSDEESGSDSDSGWENSGEEDDSAVRRPPLLTDSMGASRDDPAASGAVHDAAEEIDSAEVTSRDERLGKSDATTPDADTRLAPAGSNLSASVGAKKGNRHEAGSSSKQPGFSVKIWPRVDPKAASDAATPPVPSLVNRDDARTFVSEGWKDTRGPRDASRRSSIALLRDPGAVPHGERPLSLDHDEEGSEFDMTRVAGRLVAALRLQRLMYGLARLHLHGLGEAHTRALLDGLSTGVRYARQFQMRHTLRMALFTAG